MTLRKTIFNRSAWQSPLMFDTLLFAFFSTDENLAVEGFGSGLFLKALTERFPRKHQYLP